MKSVAIIVVTYNRLSLLQEEIEALRNQTFKDCQIIVVNNGSTDDTLSWLKQQTDLVAITQENVGGAGGFHTGMKYASEKGYKFCWIMDDDVICEPNALEELYNAWHVKENIGFVCSKVVGVNGLPMNTPLVDDRSSVNGYPDFVDLINHRMIKVKEATFVSVFLSTKLIFEIGLPYKEYFIWGDDTEYTMRISLKYDSYMACDSVVIHKRAVQAGLNFYTETNPKRLKNYFYMFRNQSMNAIKYYNAKRPKLCLRQMLQAFKDAASFKFSRSIIRFKIAVSLISFKPRLEFPTKR